MILHRDLVQQHLAPHQCALLYAVENSISIERNYHPSYKQPEPGFFVSCSALQFTLRLLFVLLTANVRMTSASRPDSFQTVKAVLIAMPSMGTTMITLIVVNGAWS